MNVGFIPYSMFLMRPHCAFHECKTLPFGEQLHCHSATIGFVGLKEVLRSGGSVVRVRTLRFFSQKLKELNECKRRGSLVERSGND